MIINQLDLSNQIHTEHQKSPMEDKKPCLINDQEENDFEDEESFAIPDEEESEDSSLNLKHLSIKQQQILKMMKDKKKNINKTLDNRESLPFRMCIDDFRTHSKTFTAISTHSQPSSYSNSPSYYQILRATRYQ